MKKSDLAELCLRRMGHPMIKIELDPQQVFDAIDYARNKFIKWAVGNATQETFFTMMLSANQYIYDMPAGVVEVIDYDDEGNYAGGINTLFTIDNYLYNQGIFDPIFHNTTGGYISYHLALDFLKTADRYSTSKYNWKYHKYTNQLEIRPPPPSGNSLSVYDDDRSVIVVDSPGFTLIKAYMIEGSTFVSDWEDGDSDEHFYGESWVLDYATAECKIVLGRIRNKFSQFQAMGNIPLSLDGADLIAEGKEEKEKLDDDLKNSEAWTGYGILMG